MMNKMLTVTACFLKKKKKIISLQMIIEQLEHERNMMTDAMAEKMRDHQHLLQVKMDLGMEVAAYR